MTQFARPPPAIPNNIAILSYPYPNVLHVALNRPKAYNAMNREFNNTLAAVFDWYENEPSLRVAILGSTNPKAWCAGADLKEWKDTNADNTPKPPANKVGFAGMSTRSTRKPVIGAIRGVALGGGSELVMNLDINVAGQTATFGFPEVKRGVSINAGGLPRFVRLVGHQKAAELILTGRNIPAKEALELRMINEVVPDANVESRALEIAKIISSNSPDSVMALLYGIRLTAEAGSLQSASDLYDQSLQVRTLLAGDNIKEGLLAFQERREPRWLPSKL
ncbi:uncharacterized protein EHS24_007350 [Apiotrichum porosum]|uniref:Enoyl-CoA hydratase n=1 Tax=Apiotrichum porosum TaxID=105984 RepID=A0A427XU59_9TREE|nr:uncharacterized protein EHS24_007350 [Apiotrichum porosum]RSH82383.1 hypothetical protein EHS24_007350 [Apiotrichum porosum]